MILTATKSRSYHQPGWPWAGLAACLLLVLTFTLAGASSAGAGARPSTLVVCSVQGGVYVVGGLFRGRWIDAEKAEGLVRSRKAGSGPWQDKVPLQPRTNRLMHKGDRLSLYRLEAGEVGEATLTSQGELLVHYEGTYGIRFDAKLRERRGKPGARPKAWSVPHPWAAGAVATDYPLETDTLAAWSPQGLKPHWVTGEVLDSKSPVYRGIVSRWLTARKVGKDVVPTVVINQVVRADIDGDGRKEVFLSLYSPAMLYPNQDTPRKDAFSYLLMRRVRPDSERVQTIVMDSQFSNEPNMLGDILWIDGFCDVDGDGTAEVIEHTRYYEGESVNLLRWRNGRFVHYEGWGSAP